MDDRIRPTLDIQHLRILAGQSSLEAAESFTAEYKSLLPGYVEQIRSTVGARNRDLALDASLRLKTKSWLVGALHMNQLCTGLELALALDDWTAATTVARNIKVHFPRLQKVLQGSPHPTLHTQLLRATRTAIAS